MTYDLNTLRLRRHAAEAALRDVEHELSRRFDRLAVLDQQIRDLEQQHVVRVRFDGSSRLYAYQLAPGPQPWAGDYVMVRDHILKVRELGRGDYTGELQRAHRVNVEILD